VEIGRRANSADLLDTGLSSPWRSALAGASTTEDTLDGPLVDTNPPYRSLSPASIAAQAIARTPPYSPPVSNAGYSYFTNRRTPISHPSPAEADTSPPAKRRHVDSSFRRSWSSPQNADGEDAHQQRGDGSHEVEQVYDPHTDQCMGEDTAMAAVRRKATHRGRGRPQGSKTVKSYDFPGQREYHRSSPQLSLKAQTRAVSFSFN
jgi:hypothetical protein